MKKSQKKQHSFAFITGATAGIGEATAVGLAEKKQALVLTGRRLDRLKKLQKVCLQKGAPEVLIYKLDIQKNAEVKKLATDLKKKKIAVKILVNNAGLAKGIGPFQESLAEDWDAMIDTNVKGLLSVTRELLPSIIENRGHVVNMGSVAGRLVYEGGTVYCATKFAVRAISDALRLDLKGTGVRVTNIEPGMVNTEFSVVRLGNQQKADAVYADMMPLTANDIANTILWCLSQPAHVNISELVIYPTDQATVGHVVRGEKSVKNLK
jgi:3-hydroxy acid dehydrogenase / malonic semialdehyde reductase